MWRVETRSGCLVCSVPLSANVHHLTPEIGYGISYRIYTKRNTVSAQIAAIEFAPLHGRREVHPQTNVEQKKRFYKTSGGVFILYDSKYSKILGGP
jgi:hypothetical protein